jgi:hypothetical protein
MQRLQHTYQPIVLLLWFFINALKQQAAATWARQTLTSWGLVVCLVGMGLTSLSAHARDYSHLLEQPFTPIGSYERKTAPSEHSPLYTPDPNVWVYTSAFAKRFGMPARWVDDSLQGAEAVAFHWDRYNYQSCGYAGSSENCMQDYNCLFDIYLSDTDSARIPWLDQVPDRGISKDQSYRFLTQQTAQDRYFWEDETRGTMFYRLGGAIETGMLMWVSGPPKKNPDKVYSYYGSSTVKAYQRNFFKDLDMIKVSDCGLANETPDSVRFFFTDPMPSMYHPEYRDKNGEILHDKLEQAEKARYANNFSGNPPHQVSLPDAYMARVNIKDQQTSQGGLADKVLNGFGDDKDDKPGLWQRLINWW